jgi:hypothetical protein
MIDSIVRGQLSGEARFDCVSKDRRARLRCTFLRDAVCESVLLVLLQPMTLRTNS